MGARSLFSYTSHIDYKAYERKIYYNEYTLEAKNQCFVYIFYLEKQYFTIISLNYL